MFQKRYIIFIPYLEGRFCESNFKYLYKKYLDGVRGTSVTYGPELLICRPNLKQLSLHILSRKLKLFCRISWGNYAIKQIYIFWRIFQGGTVRMYKLQTWWSNLKTKWKQYKKDYIARNELITIKNHLNEI